MPTSWQLTCDNLSTLSSSKVLCTACILFSKARRCHSSCLLFKMCEIYHKWRQMSWYSIISNIDPSLLCIKFQGNHCYGCQDTRWHNSKGQMIHSLRNINVCMNFHSNKFNCPSRVLYCFFQTDIQVQLYLPWLCTQFFWAIRYSQLWSFSVLHPNEIVWIIQQIKVMWSNTVKQGLWASGVLGVMVVASFSQFSLVSASPSSWSLLLTPNSLHPIFFLAIFSSAPLEAIKSSLSPINKV